MNSSGRDEWRNLNAWAYNQLWTNCQINHLERPIPAKFDLRDDALTRMYLTQREVLEFYGNDHLGGQKIDKRIVESLMKLVRENSEVRRRDGRKMPNGLSLRRTETHASFDDDRRVLTIHQSSKGAVLASRADPTDILKTSKLLEWLTNLALASKCSPPSSLRR